jgi:hypothetical protein
MEESALILLGLICLIWVTIFGLTLLAMYAANKRLYKEE